MRTQLLRSGITAIASFLGLAGLVLFVAVGPALSTSVSAFVSIVLLTLAALLVVSAGALLSTAIGAFAYQRLRIVRVSVDIFDLQELLEEERQILATLRREYHQRLVADLAGWMEEALAAETVDRPAILQRRLDELERSIDRDVVEPHRAVVEALDSRAAIAL